MTKTIMCNSLSPGGIVLGDLFGGPFRLQPAVGRGVGPYLRGGRKDFCAGQVAGGLSEGGRHGSGDLDRGQISGAVLYNQGNAFMQAGQRGRAIAAYRQARRYLGPDLFLEANLAYALGNQPAVGVAP